MNHVYPTVAPSLPLKQFPEPSALAPSYSATLRRTEGGTTAPEAPPTPKYTGPSAKATSRSPAASKTERGASSLPRLIRTASTSHTAAPASSPSGPTSTRRSKTTATTPVTSPPARSTKPTSKPASTKTLRNNRLGTLVQSLSQQFRQAGSWEKFVASFRGPSYLSPTLEDLPHPAAELLRTWRDEGVPAESSSPPWTDAQKEECIRRGCHTSATLHSDFLREEMAEFIENRFWAVLPYDLVKHLEDLQLWPAAVKDERDRKP